jgi:hypothetical protein
MFTLPRVLAKRGGGARDTEATSSESHSYIQQSCSEGMRGIGKGYSVLISSHVDRWSQVRQVLHYRGCVVTEAGVYVSVL